MTRLALPPLPSRAGSYRWFYTDVHAPPYTAVCIFMVGAVFSPRYAAERGAAARPERHCAVNFALYRGGTRLAWVFSEYPGATTTDGLAIGASVLRYTPAGEIVITVDERTAPWGEPARARLTLVPGAPCGPELVVDGEGRHRWQPLVVRAAARLELPGRGEAVTGLGYHDTNHGEERLGERVPGWHWARIHGPEKTLVSYQLPAVSRATHVMADDTAVAVTHEAPRRAPSRTSAWGLALPTSLEAGGRRVPATRLLESSPFYARQEGEADGWHALAEVADFRRFRSPFIRWMAYFRLRREAVA